MFVTAKRGSCRRLTTKLVFMMPVLCAGIFVSSPVNAQSIWPVDGSYEVTMSDSTLPKIVSCTQEKITVYRQSATIPTQLDACVQRGMRLQFAVYYDAAGRDTYYAVRFLGDQYFRTIQGYRANIYAIRFLEKTGAAVLDYTYYQVPAELTKLSYVDDLAGALEPSRTNGFGLTYNYQIKSDAVQRMFAYGDAPGDRESPTSYVVSGNQKQVFAYLNYTKFVTLDLNRMAYNTVAYFKTGWWGGIYIPTPAAISNDGKYIFIGGLHKIYSTVGCGDAFIAERRYDSYMTNSCAETTVQSATYPIIKDDNYLYRYAFSDDNGQLLFQRGADSTIRSLHAIGYEPTPRLEYLALGDSYSSGEGDTESHNDSSFYLPGTDTAPNTCHISSRSYPFLLRNAWGIATDEMRSVACSGAQVLPDYIGPMDNYLGQNQRLKGAADIDSVRSSALDDFTPGQVRQIEFVKRYQPKVVTFTGGGNDVGFGDIISYCATPTWQGIFVNDTCAYAIEGSYLNETLYDSIDTQALYAKMFVDEVKAVSPATKIVMIGYPIFVASDKVCLLNSAALNNLEIKMINNAVSYMNTMLKRVAAEEGVLYVDIEDSLNGGRLCEGSEYMTGIMAPMLKNMKIRDDPNMFHPNANGHAKIAETIEAANIPGRNMPTELLDPSGETEPSVAIQTQLIDRDIVLTTSSSANVETATQTFADGSTVTTATFSDRTGMGTYAATTEGALSATLDFSAVGPGQHVLVVEGLSPSGEPVKLYQFITVRVSETDADGDGVLDVQDRCTFIDHWFDETTGEDVCAQDVDSGENIPDAILPTDDGNIEQSTDSIPTEAESITIEQGQPVSRQYDVKSRNTLSRDLTADVLGDSTLSVDDELATYIQKDEHFMEYWLLLCGVGIMIGGITYGTIFKKKN